jgi:hypothetical protein
VISPGNEKKSSVPEPVFVKDSVLIMAGMPTDVSAEKIP